MSSWKNCSPTADQRTGIGVGIKAIHDPYLFTRYIAYGSQGGLICDDITVAAPTWRSVSLSSNTTGGWSQLIDFTKTDGNFAGGGTWTLGTGWTTTDEVDGTGHWHRYINIALAFPMTATSVSMKFNMTKGAFSLDDTALVIATQSFATILNSRLASATSSGSNQTFAWSGSATAFTALQLRVECSFGNAAVDLTGSATLLSVTISGDGASPFGGSSSGTQSFIADITGTIASRGRFWWLSTDGTALMVNRTTDYFQSVQTSGSIAPYTAGMNYSISPNSYDGNGVDVSAGTLVYSSVNGGKTFSSTGTGLTAGGGAIAVPYNLGSAANAGSPPEFFAITGASGAATLCHVPGGGVGTVFSAGSQVVPSHGVGQLTIDANTVTAVSTAGSLAVSGNAGSTWSLAGGTIPINAGSVNGVSGLPNRGSALMVYGKNTLAVTDNAGGTWFDIWTDSYQAFAVATYGTAVATNIVSAQVRLDVLYSAPVTT